uniref:Coat protein n=1 Tax=Erysiphales associated totivirus 22 TaxID=2719852 RepID=A0A6G9ELR8_9VIRU|nr:coat protein [Erysiphales associated totivirus 22]
MYTQLVKDMFNGEFASGSTVGKLGKDFSLANFGRALFTTEKREYESELQLASDFVSVGWQPSRYDLNVCGDISGYNKKLLDSHGFVDLDAVITECTRSAMSTKLPASKIRNVNATVADCDSQEAFLYNMLVSWFKAYLSDADNSSFTIKAKAFSDTHLRLPMANGNGDIDYEVRLGVPAPTRTNKVYFTPRDETNYWERPYVVKFSARSSAQQAFYLAHVLGRESQHVLNAEFDIDSLPIGNTLFESVGEDLPEKIDFSSIEWTNYRLMEMWIRDYVVLNRCYVAYAAALDLLGALAYQPMPSFHESMWWNNLDLRVHLAPFAPTRARIPNFADGEMAMEDVTIYEFFKTDGADLDTFLLNSAIINYSVWMGLYAIVENAANGVDDWNVVLRGGDENTSLMQGADVRAQLSSIILGKEVTSFSSRNCYLDFDTEVMSDENVCFSALESIDGSTKTEMEIDRPVPYVSGSLLLGVMNVQMEAFEHLQAQQTVNIRQSGRYGRQDLLKLANIYRLFGHEVQVKSQHTRQPVNLWANRRELVLPYFNLASQYDDDALFLISGSTRRRGRADPILNAVFLESESSVQLSLVKPVLKITVYGSRVERASIFTRRKQKVVTFCPRVRSTGGSTKRVIRGTLPRAPLEQDFHEANVSPRPGTPTNLVRAAQPVQPSHQQEEEDVNFVE